MIVRTFLSLVVAVVPAALANAQTWSELQTLTFSPTPAGSPLAAPGSRNTGQSSQGRGGAAGDEPDEFIVTRVQAVLDDIASYESANGPHAPGLVPMLGTLADLHQQFDDYGAAIAALERAQDIVRRWQGLDTLDQAEMIEQIIAIRMAIAPNEESVEEESHLRELVRSNPADPRNVGILVNMAGRQMDIVQDLLENGLPPDIAVNVSLFNGANSARFAPPRNTYSMAAAMLRRARNSYNSALREAIATNSGDISQLFELETSVIDTYYLELINLRLRGGRPGYSGAGALFSEGFGALEARLENTRRFRNSPEAVTRALIELADWQLMFGSFGRALDMYEEAAAELRAMGGSEALVDALFAPPAPVPLPESVANASRIDVRSDVQGFLDVEIAINRFGGVHDVKVTGRSDNASATIERRLKRFVYQTRFRPRYIDGEWQLADRFSLRYTFGYSTS